MKIPIAKPVNEILDIKNFDARFIKEVKSGMYIGGKNVSNYEDSLKNFLVRSI